MGLVLSLALFSNMFNNLLNIAKSATSFLQNGIAPPNTPEAYRVAFEEQNHLASKKFFIIFSAILMLAFVFYTSTAILIWVVPRVPEVVAAFVTIFTKVIEIFGIVISVYIGAQGLIDLRYSSTSDASIQAEIQKIDQTVTEILTNNTKEEDYSISDDKV